METRSTSLEASTDLPIPESVWAAFISNATALCAELFPQALVSVAVVDAAGIRQLNKRYRGVDAATDVLSFPADERAAPLSAAEARALQGHAGDIALCWDAVAAQATANANPLLTEASALMAHSLLHLAGYDHRNDEEQAVMDRLTVKLCSAAGVEVEHFGH